MGTCAGVRKVNPEEENNAPTMDERLEWDSDLDFIPLENRLEDFMSFFETMKVLGSGSTCSVSSMHHLDADKNYAVKTMLRSHKSNKRGFKREAQILMKINHNHIVGLFGAFVDIQNFYIVQELCTGGMVLDHVRTLRQFSEADAIEITYQILDAVKYMHDHNVVHRDIKPDNIVYQSSNRTRVVLIDFGQAREIREQEEFKDWVGTPAYMAPEVTRTRTGAELKKVDVWAVGITVYIMLTGHLPFFGSNVRELLREVCQKKLAFPRNVNVPEGARRFVASLLRRNVNNRLSAADALAHPWCQSERSRTSKAYLKTWTDNLASFHHSSRLKQVVIDMVLQDLDESMEQILAAAFNLIDIEQDGSIDEVDIRVFLENRGMTEDRAGFRAKMLYDALGGGEEKVDIDQVSFARAHLTAQIGGDEATMRKVFDKFDEDGDGRIDVMEIKHGIKNFLYESVNSEEAFNIIDEVDQDGDGSITFDEFRDAMKHITIRSARVEPITEDAEIEPKTRADTESMPV